MVTEVELYADIDEFEPGYEGICAVLNLYGKDESGARERTKWERAEYPGHLIPENGRYPPAKFTVSVTASEKRREVDQKVGPVESVAEFRAEVFEMDIDSPVFWLRDINDGTKVGQVELKPDRLPGLLDDIGDHSYVTVWMEYDHEWTAEVLTERLGESEEEIELRRESTTDWFEEWDD